MGEDTVNGKLIFGAPKTFGTDKDNPQVSIGVNPVTETIALYLSKDTSFMHLSAEEASELGRMLLAYAHSARKTHRFHRKALKAPTDIGKRKQMVSWVLGHPLWEHPCTVKIPPKDTLLTIEEILDAGPGPDWETRVVTDGCYLDCIHFECVFVNPENEYIEEDTRLNKAFRVWVEAGGWFDLSTDPEIPAPPEGWNDQNRWIPTHNPNLDCGGEDIESALIELGLRLKFFYNDNGTEKNFPEDCGGYLLDENDDNSYMSNCTDAGDGFCMVCGYAIEEPDPEP